MFQRKILQVGFLELVVTRREEVEEFKRTWEIRALCVGYVENLVIALNIASIELVGWLWIVKGLEEIAGVLEDVIVACLVYIVEEDRICRILQETMAPNVMLRNTHKAMKEIGTWARWILATVVHPPAKQTCNPYPPTRMNSRYIMVM